MQRPTPPIRFETHWAAIDLAFGANSNAELQRGLIAVPQLNISGAVISWGIDPSINPHSPPTSLDTRSDRLSLGLGPRYQKVIRSFNKQPPRSPVSPVVIMHCLLNPDIMDPDKPRQKYEIQPPNDEDGFTLSAARHLAAPALVGLVEYNANNTQQPLLISDASESSATQRTPEGKNIRSYWLESTRVSIFAVQPGCRIQIAKRGGVSNQLEYNPKNPKPLAFS